MNIDTNRAQRNISYARRWLDRAMKDFNLFKKIVPFDRRTNKPIRCSDSALAVYLLQQSVEKAVKAAAIASGQYKARNFIHYYRHNSLALIMNLNNKIVAQIQAMGLGPVAKMMGIDLADGESKLNEANLSGANLEGADLYRAYFYKACLYKASLQRADLSNAFLTEANLKDADLREANLTGVNLSNAFLVNTDFRRADLSEVKCNEGTVLPNGTKWTPDTDTLSEETWMPMLKGYCHTCKAAWEIKDPEKVTLKSGASVIKGSCAQCGNPVSRLRNR